ncbi:MAG: alkaline phosphatase PhoX, partial [Alphaproteobacteria bacterium]
DIVLLGTDRTDAVKRGAASNIPYHPKAIPFANPDNLTFTPDGTLWVCTDGAPKSAGVPDALYALKEKAKDKHWVLETIYRVPVGAEPCAPTFSPDEKSLFLSVQHPAQKAPPTPPAPAGPIFPPSYPRGHRWWCWGRGGMVIRAWGRGSGEDYVPSPQRGEGDFHAPRPTHSP